MSNRRRHRPTRAERELVQMTGGIIPADDLIQIARHSHYVNGTLCVDQVGMRLLARYSPLGADVASPLIERLITAIEERYATPTASDDTDGEGEATR